MAAHDLNGAGAYLRARPEVDPRRIFVLGLGDAGRFALFAAALGSQWAGVAADDVGPLYADLEPNRGVANLLRHGDLPQVAVLAAPRRLWLNRTGSRFTFTVEGYRQLSHAKAVRCSDISVAEFDAAIPGWVANTN